MKRGSLTVVGTGIRFFSQITEEAMRAIQTADHVLFLAEEPTERWIQKTVRSSENLGRFYDIGKNRRQTYQEMIDRILTCVREGMRVCGAFYGHPGIYGFPPHESVRLAQAEGYDAVMLPGISAIDCLFADLEIDPRIAGYQSFEATAFLINKCEFDVTTPLILWQINTVGSLNYSRIVSRPGLIVLCEFLSKLYGPDHKVVIYEAAQQPLAQPNIQLVTIKELANAPFHGASTLYVPPRGARL